MGAVTMGARMEAVSAGLRLNRPLVPRRAARMRSMGSPTILLSATHQPASRNSTNTPAARSEDLPTPEAPDR